MLGNTGTFDEYETAFAPTTLTIVYIITTLIIVVVMLNLLISIIGNTYGSVSEINELIYEKNRLMIIKDFLSEEENREKLKHQLDQYLMTIYRDDPEVMDLSDMEKKLKSMEKKFDKRFEV